MYIRANINGWHTVLHLNEGETEATVIAFPQDAEKADFMVKALNSYGLKIGPEWQSVEMAPEGLKKLFGGIPNGIDNEL